MQDITTEYIDIPRIFENLSDEGTCTSEELLIGQSGVNPMVMVDNPRDIVEYPDQRDGSIGYRYIQRGKKPICIILEVRFVIA